MLAEVMADAYRKPGKLKKEEMQVESLERVITEAYSGIFKQKSPLAYILPL